MLTIVSGSPPDTGIDSYYVQTAQPTAWRVATAAPG